MEVDRVGVLALGIWRRQSHAQGATRSEPGKQIIDVAERVTWWCRWTAAQRGAQVPDRSDRREVEMRRMVMCPQCPDHCESQRELSDEGASLRARFDSHGQGVQRLPRMVRGFYGRETLKRFVTTTWLGRTS